MKIFSFQRIHRLRFYVFVFLLIGMGEGLEGEIKLPPSGEVEESESDWDRDSLKDWWEKKHQGRINGGGYSVVGGEQEQFSTVGFGYEQMVGWWQMDQDREGKDRSVNQKGLVGMVGIEWKDEVGIYGQAFGKGYVRLNGSEYLSSSVTTPYNNMSGQWSFSVWVRKYSGSGIAGSWRDVNGLGWEVGVKEDGRIRAKIIVGGDRREKIEVILEKVLGKNIRDGQWHHLVLVSEGERGKLYVDGELESEKGWRGSQGMYCAKLHIGAGPSGEYFQGDLDEVRLYKKGYGAGSVRCMPSTMYDTDGDWASNLLEQGVGSDPLKPDSDGDGMLDGEEYSDADGDGMYSGWELDYGLDPQDSSDAGGDLDEDGLSNLEEFENGTNPQDYYNGNLNGVEIALISGNNQVGQASQELGAPVVVKVSKNGVGLNKAPIKVTLIGAPSEVGEVSGELKTDVSGKGSVKWKLGPKEFAQNYAEVKVESAGQSKAVSVSALGLPVVPMEGLKMWINGEKLGAAGSLVGMVEDWSSANNDAQQSGGEKKPQVKMGWNGRKAMEFDGVDDELNFTPILGEEATVVLVYETSAYSGLYSGPITNNPSGVGANKRGFRVMAMTPNPQYPPIGEADTEYLLSEDGLAVYVPGWSTKESYQQKEALVGKGLPTGPELQVWKSQKEGPNSNVWFYRDGKNVGVKTGIPYVEEAGWGASQAAIGRASKTMAGQIAEVMVWDRMLSEAERGEVEDYLKKRYGMNDEDGDGVVTWKEIQLGLDPKKWDSNGDGVKDGIVFEFAYGVGANGELLKKTLDGSSNDNDQDGLSNAEELWLGTNPYWNDTDLDGVLDGADPLPFDGSENGSSEGVPLELLNISEPAGAEILP